MTRAALIFSDLIFIAIPLVVFSLLVYRIVQKRKRIITLVKAIGALIVWYGVSQVMSLFEFGTAWSIAHAESSVREEIITGLPLFFFVVMYVLIGDGLCYWVRGINIKD